MMKATVWKRMMPLALIAGCILTACEESNHGNSGEIPVYPSHVDLMGVTNMVTFTADVSISGTDTNGSSITESIAYPLEWSVERPSMGSMVSHSGNQAVYVHVYGNLGANVITVRDGYGREGIATVSMLPEPTPTPAP